jgi:alkylation response protein AidB-like acyl-CoA dehydrogenase
VIIHDDWDALGMRASGSNSISLMSVELPEPAVRGGFRAGDPLPYMERNLTAGLFHAAASLGIAESADAIAVAAIARRIASVPVIQSTHADAKGASDVTAHVPAADGPQARPAAPPRVTATSRGPTISTEGIEARTCNGTDSALRPPTANPDDARLRMQVADNVVDLAAARGVLSRAAALIDEHRAANPASDGTLDEIAGLFAEAQAAKAFVNDAAARVVDRALTLSGGAGYLNGSPLARAYRDVRAGSFMHPLGANRAYDHLSRVALGEQPQLH